MVKKILLIVGIAAVLGVTGYVLAEEKVADSNNPKKEQKEKADRRRPGEIGKRFDKWMDELNKAYQAKDMEKIGQLIEKMNKAREQMKEKIQQMREKSREWQNRSGEFGRGMGHRPMGRERFGYYGGMSYGYHNRPMPTMIWGGSGDYDFHKHMPPMRWGGRGHYFPGRVRRRNPPSRRTSPYQV